MKEGTKFPWLGLSICVGVTVCIVLAEINKPPPPPPKPKSRARRVVEWALEPPDDSRIDKAAEKWTTKKDE